MVSESQAQADYDRVMAKSKRAFSGPKYDSCARCHNFRCNHGLWLPGFRWFSGTCKKFKEPS